MRCAGGIAVIFLPKSACMAEFGGGGGVVLIAVVGAAAEDDDDVETSATSGDRAGITV